jgi:hypothetical protein
MEEVQEKEIPESQAEITSLYLPGVYAGRILRNHTYEKDGVPTRRFLVETSHEFKEHNAPFLTEEQLQRGWVVIEIPDYLVPEVNSNPFDRTFWSLISYDGKFNILNNQLKEARIVIESLRDAGKTVNKELTRQKQINKEIVEGSFMEEIKSVLRSEVREVVLEIMEKRKKDE